MANVNRYRWGDQEILIMTVDDGIGVEIGDFMALAAAADNSADGNITAGNAIPVGNIADAGDAAANREAGADQFLGISLDAKVAADPDQKIRIATKGFFELTQQSAAAIDLGDQLEVYASADHCSDQEVVEGTTSPIAVCWETKSASGTGVLCKLMGSKLLDPASQT